jgi:Rrf2 family protein
VLYLARESKDLPVQLHDISAALNIPYHFLSKVLQSLTRDALVVSHKGPNGGFTLGRPASEAFLIDIVCAIDGETFFDSCVLGFPSCGDSSPCPAHQSWKEAKQIIQDMLRNKTIADLSGALEPKLSLIEQLSH